MGRRRRPVRTGEGLPVLPGFREIAERRQSLLSALVGARQAAGLSQADVASRMGTSQPAVARLETGEVDVRLSTLERYAAAVGHRLDFRVEATTLQPGTSDQWAQLPSSEERAMKQPGPPQMMGGASGEPSPPEPSRPEWTPEWTPGWPPGTPPQTPPGRPPGQPPGYPPGQPPEQFPFRPSTGEGWLAERLHEQRLVLIHGPLDQALATRVTAELLTLDATGSHRIRIHLASSDGDLGAALALADTLDLLRVSVHVVAVGEVGGPAVAVLTAADKAQALPHARFRLSEPKVDISGRADEVATLAEQQAQMVKSFIGRIAEATGQEPDQVAEDLRAGRYLSAVEAVDYGLVDSVLRPETRGADWL